MVGTRKVDLTFSEKVKIFASKAKDEAKQTGAKTVRWIEENKELVIVMVPLAGALLKTGQSMLVSHRQTSERNRIDRTYYDPSTGFHWELRRKATNADRAEILRRKGQGQETYTILKQMGLIK